MAEERGELNLLQVVLHGDGATCGISQNGYTCKLQRDGHKTELRNCNKKQYFSRHRHQHSAITVFVAFEDHSRETLQAQGGSTAFPCSTANGYNFKTKREKKYSDSEFLHLHGSSVVFLNSWSHSVFGCAACRWRLTHFKLTCWTFFVMQCIKLNYFILFCCWDLVWKVF